MFGAIIGDIIGSPYEFDHRNYKAKDFPFFAPGCDFTDDSVMTLAVADALLALREDKSKEELMYLFTSCMHKLGRAYPDAGYGIRFAQWIRSKYPEPYGSYGNGAAMRVSPIAWAFDSFSEVLRVAEASALVSHDHPEGIAAAKGIAGAIFLARTGSTKAEIRKFFEADTNWKLDFSCDDIRPTYRHVESCRNSVPQAMEAFMESTDFEDCIRLAVSIGGDSDTIAAIAGSVAEAFYGIPGDLKEEAVRRLTPELAGIAHSFHVKFMEGREK